MSTRKSKSLGTATLMVRLDQESKDTLTQAALVRKISVSDYVRIVTVTQARKDVSASLEQAIALSQAEQIAFWTALNQTPKLTPAQKKLSKTMRGET